MKLRTVICVGALLALVASADAQVRRIGDWTLTERTDSVSGRVDLVAELPDIGKRLLVRCLSGKFSLAIEVANRHAFARTGYPAKLRVDEGATIQTVANHLDERMVQIDAKPSLLAELRGGKRLAVTLERGTTSTWVFGLGRAGQALASLTSGCSAD